MNQLCSTTPEVIARDFILMLAPETSIKIPLNTAYVFNDIDLGDGIMILAGEMIEIIDYLEESIYLAQRNETIFAVSALNEVRINNYEREVEWKN